MHSDLNHCTVDMRIDTRAHHKLFHSVHVLEKGHITRSTARELLKLVNGSGASVEGLVLCGLSCERRAVVSAESAEGVEG